MFIFAKKVFGNLFISGTKSQVGSRPPQFWVF